MFVSTVAPSTPFLFLPFFPLRVVEFFHLYFGRKYSKRCKGCTRESFESIKLYVNMNYLFSVFTLYEKYVSIKLTNKSKRYTILKMFFPVQSLRKFA